jgi:hypothetical protein
MRKQTKDSYKSLILTRAPQYCSVTDCSKAVTPQVFFVVPLYKLGCSLFLSTFWLCGEAVLLCMAIPDKDISLL